MNRTSQDRALSPEPSHRNPASNQLFDFRLFAT